MILMMISYACFKQSLEGGIGQVYIHMLITCSINRQIFCRSSIDIEQVVVSRQDMKLLEVLAGRVREERREEEVLTENS